MLKRAKGGGLRLYDDPPPKRPVSHKHYEALLAAVVERAYKDLIGQDLSSLVTCDTDAIRNDAYDFFRSGRCKAFTSIEGRRFIERARLKGKLLGIPASRAKAKAIV